MITNKKNKEKSK